MASRLLIGPTMSRFAAVALVLATTTAAHAAPATETSDVKSESGAVGLSVASTVAGGALFAAGLGTESGPLLAVGAGALILGPSAGHWYAGKSLTWGLPIRIAGAGLAVMGTYEAIGCVIAADDDGCSAPEMVIGGLVLVGVGTVLDIATAGRSAREYNERHWQVTPTLVSDGQSQGMGLGIGGSF